MLPSRRSHIRTEVMMLKPAVEWRWRVMQEQCLSISGPTHDRQVRIASGALTPTADSRRGGLAFASLACCSHRRKADRCEPRHLANSARTVADIADLRSNGATNPRAKKADESIIESVVSFRSLAVETLLTFTPALRSASKTAAAQSAAERGNVSVGCSESPSATLAV